MKNFRYISGLFLGISILSIIEILYIFCRWIIKKCVFSCRKQKFSSDSSMFHRQRSSHKNIEDFQRELIEMLNKDRIIEKLCNDYLTKIHEKNELSIKIDDEDDDIYSEAPCTIWIFFDGELVITKDELTLLILNVSEMNNLKAFIKN